jgi:hypothetical protein
VTERFALVERNPRLVAGLWFATFIGSASLLMSLAISFLVTRLAQSPRLPSAWWLGLGLHFAATAVVGGWLGAGLLKPGASTAEAVRRGGWIGILTGVAQTLVGVLLQQAITFESLQEAGSWYSAARLAMSAFFRAGWLLPIGVLAGSCLVRVTQIARRST